VHTLVHGDASKPTVFLVDKDLPGVELVRTPKYMHTFVFEHPIFAFRDEQSHHRRKGLVGTEGFVGLARCCHFHSPCLSFTSRGICGVR